MTPQEKAKSLVTDFAFQIKGKNDYFIDAKQCALIAVDLVLSTNLVSPPKTYWNEVKQEINKL